MDDLFHFIYDEFIYNGLYIIFIEESLHKTKVIVCSPVNKGRIMFPS